VKLADDLLAKLSLLACYLIVGATFQHALAGERDQFHVGLQPDGRVVVPTNQILEPAGTQVTFPGRPVDLALSEDGKLLFDGDIETEAQQQKVPVELWPRAQLMLEEMGPVADSETRPKAQPAEKEKD